MTRKDNGDDDDDREKNDNDKSTDNVKVDNVVVDGNDDDNVGGNHDHHHDHDDDCDNNSDVKEDEIKSTDEIDIVQQGQQRKTIHAFERFQFVEAIYYKGKLIMVEKLYGTI
jgi:hypothetical protein